MGKKHRNALEDMLLAIFALWKKTAIVSLIQSSMAVRGTMDLFQHRYYRLNKMLMKLIGEWPYQSTRIRFVIAAVLFCIVVSVLVPQVIAVVKHLDDWDFVMECAAPFIFDATCIIKFLTSLFNSRKMLRLLNHMRTDWDVWARDRDVDVLHEHAERGRKMMIAYVDLSMLRTVAAYASGFIILTQPIMPKVMDVLLKNGTQRGKFPIPVDYYHIDEQKYYFYIVLHFYVVGSTEFTINIACDSMFMVYVQHGCALFAAVGRKLERIGKTERSAEMGEITHALDKPGVDIENLTSCIDRHNDAIKYAELIEATYTWCFFGIVGICMFLISVTGLQVVKTTIDFQEIIKVIVINVSSIVQLYIGNYMSQILTDNSISIRYYILNSEWYRLPLKDQKLLLLMIMRCNVPCKLTAGKMSILSIETFMILLNTSLSYFTLLRSV